MSKKENAEDYFHQMNAGAMRKYIAGLCGKEVGRIGDSTLIGMGTFADNCSGVRIDFFL